MEEVYSPILDIVLETPPQTFPSQYLREIDFHKPLRTRSTETAKGSKRKEDKKREKSSSIDNLETGSQKIISSYHS